MSTNICNESGCINTNALFHFKNKKDKYCQVHMKPGMLITKKCIICDRKALHYNTHNIIEMYCAKHKTPNSVILTNNKCNYENCNSYASYNYNGLSVKKFCSKHKQPEMVAVNRKKCKHESCNKIPFFNYKNELLGLYCNTHKSENMINIHLHKTCIESNCNVYPCFNIKGTKSGLYCNIHKKDNMVNINFSLCQETNCDRYARYNFIDKKKSLYCNTHKKDEMIDINNKLCNETNCKLIARYNYGNNKAEYCKLHKKDGMLKPFVNRCKASNCIKYASFTYENNKSPEYCSIHKKSDMSNVMSPVCIEDNCRTGPSYNYEGQYPALYCVKHKKENMIDVNSKHCNTLNCYIHANEKYKGYCLRCFVNLFPDEPNTRNYKTKEQAVADHIKTSFNQYDWIYDKRVQDGCSNRRPDIILDLGIQVIIIEVDENQHIKYDCSCENKRLMEISQDIRHRPLVFIRFNPDGYNTSTSHIQSCWSYNKNGICIVKREKELLWKQRLDALDEQIRYWCENTTEKTVEVVELFYDCD
jgi:hypothetical protein